MSGSTVASAIRSRGGIDWLFEQIAEGQTITALAKQLGVGRTALSMWLNRPGRKERLIAAQQEGAYALTEESQHIADNIKPETGTDGTTVIVPMSEALAKARIQIDVRRDRAAVLNREVFGKSAPKDDHDLGELFIAALMSVSKRRPTQGVTTEPIVAEIVPEQAPKALPSGQTGE